MLLFSKFKIVGHSMEPFLNDGEKIIISSLPYLFSIPKINDIVAFKDKENKILIKRIKDIQDKKYFVQGDNKKDSLDSSSFGEIYADRILGKFILKL